MAPRSNDARGFELCTWNEPAGHSRCPLVGAESFLFGKAMQYWKAESSTFEAVACIPHVCAVCWLLEHFGPAYDSFQILSVALDYAVQYCKSVGMEVRQPVSA